MNNLSLLVQTGINFLGAETSIEQATRFFEYLKKNDLVDNLRWWLSQDDAKYSREWIDPVDLYEGIRGYKDWTDNELISYLDDAHFSVFPEDEIVDYIKEVEAAKIPPRYI